MSRQTNSPRKSTDIETLSGYSSPTMMNSDNTLVDKKLSGCISEEPQDPQPSGLSPLQAMVIDDQGLIITRG